MITSPNKFSFDKLYKLSTKKADREFISPPPNMIKKIHQSNINLRTIFRLTKFPCNFIFVKLLAFECAVTSTRKRKLQPLLLMFVDQLIWFASDRTAESQDRESNYEKTLTRKRKKSDEKKILFQNVKLFLKCRV